MKRFVFVIMLLVAMTMGTLVGCGNSSDSKNEDAEKEKTVADTDNKQEQKQEDSKGEWVGGYVCHSSNIFFDAIGKGLEEGAAENGGKIIRQDSELDMKKELSIVENFISQGVDVIFLTPNDISGSIESVKKANDANIPVVVISSTLNEGDYKTLASIKSDDYTAASEVAEYAMDKINKEGNVLILNGMQTSDVIDRIKGYKDTIAKYPDVTIANEVIVNENSVSACTQALENMLTAQPDAKAILCFNGFGIPAACAALENLDMDTSQICVVDVDGLPEEADLLASGKMKNSAAVGQNSRGFGKEAVSQFMKYKEAPDSWEYNQLIEVPTVMITPENAAEYDVYKW